MIPVKKATKVESTDDLSVTGNPWIPAPPEGWRLYVRRIVINVIISAAQSWTFRAADSNQEIAILPVTPQNAGDAIIVFGHVAPFALGVAEGVEVIASAAGIEAIMSFDGFRVKV